KCPSDSPGVTKRPRRSITLVDAPACRRMASDEPTAMKRPPLTAKPCTSAPSPAAVNTLPLTKMRSASCAHAVVVTALRPAIAQATRAARPRPTRLNLFAMFCVPLRRVRRPLLKLPRARMPHGDGGCLRDRAHTGVDEFGADLVEEQVHDVRGAGRPERAKPVAER